MRVDVLLIEECVGVVKMQITIIVDLKNSVDNRIVKENYQYGGNISLNITTLTTNVLSSCIIYCKCNCSEVCNVRISMIDARYFRILKEQVMRDCCDCDFVIRIYIYMYIFPLKADDLKKNVFPLTFHNQELYCA